MQEIKAIYMKTIYTKDNFKICRYKNPDTGKTYTALGNNLPTTKAQYILTGKWKRNNIKYTEQFHVESYSQVEMQYTNKKEEIMTILKAINGIGESMAQKIYEAYADESLEKIQDIESIKKIKGIGEKKAEKIKEAYINDLNLKGVQNIYNFLNNICNDFNFKAAQHIQNNFKGIKTEDMIQRIKDNPYIFFEYLTFQQMEDIARQYTKDYMKKQERICGAIYEILKKAHTQGDMCVPLQNVLLYTKKILQFKNNDEYLIKNEIKRAESPFIIIGIHVYLKKIYQLERTLSIKIFEKIKEEIKEQKATDIIQDIKNWQKINKIKLSKEQQQAIVSICNNNISLIVGGAGTGKTTTIKAIADIYEKYYGNITLASPTGKASRILTQATGREARTIHSILRITTETAIENIEEIKKGLLVIDEASMIDEELMFAIFVGMQKDTKIVLVGDTNQLPPVNAGQPFQDMQKIKNINIKKLQYIYRTSDSEIIKNADSIIKGNPFLIYNNTFQYIATDEKTPQESIKNIISIYNSEIKENAFKTLLCVCPTKNKGGMNVDYINKAIQEKIQEGNAEKIQISTKRSYYTRDKIIQIKNTQEIMNGDIGTIRKIDNDNVTIEFENGKIIEYKKNELTDNIDLAYAVTIHKAQGSEAETVIFVCMGEHQYQLDRTMIYTAITRAKDKIYIIGDIEAIQNGIKKERKERQTKLVAFINYEMKKEEKLK